MSDLWTVGEIARAVNGQCLQDHDGLGISSVSIDSRSLEKDALYVAIQGVSQDGHKFVKAAFDAGAGVALVRDDYVCVCDEVCIRVPDTLVALEGLARAARERSQAKVIAVTGSAGKTGTKAALQAMLAPTGLTHASVKSFNNHWGVPLSLARMLCESAYGVFEVGMNHAGEILPLSKMIGPDVALITTVAPVHIGYFANEEEIADAKAEIFAGVGPEGAVVLPADNRHFPRLVEAARRANVGQVLGFGQSQLADFCLIEGQFGPDGSTVEADIRGTRVSFQTSMPGAHIALNLIGALGCVHLVGGDQEKAVRVIAALEAPEGRGGRFDLILPEGQALLIDESYNANPASMEIALKNLSMIKGPTPSRRIAVLGDMLELGARSKAYHSALEPLIRTLDIDQVYASGEMMKGLFDVLPEAKKGAFMPCSLDLCGVIEKNMQRGDVIMVKGSLGSDMGAIVSHLREKFSL